MPMKSIRFSRRSATSVKQALCEYTKDCVDSVTGAESFRPSITPMGRIQAWRNAKPNVRYGLSTGQPPVRVVVLKAP